MQIRDRLFHAIVSPWVPEGCTLPWWAIALRGLLFPLDSLFWAQSTRKGYQIQSNTWLIHGVRFTDEALLFLAHADGALFRIKRSDSDVVTLERITLRED